MIALALPFPYCLYTSQCALFLRVVSGPVQHTLSFLSIVHFPGGNGGSIPSAGGKSFFFSRFHVPRSALGLLRP